MFVMTGISCAVAQCRRFFVARGWARLQRFLEGDPLAFDETPLPPAVRARFRAEQLHDLERSTPALLLVSCASALAVCFVVRDTSFASLAEFWAAAIVVFSMVVYALGRRNASPQRVSRATAFALVHGMLWGALPALVLPDANMREQFVVTGFVFATLFGGAFSLSMIPSALLAHVVPISAGFIFAVFSERDRSADLVAIMVAVYAVVTVAGALKRAAAAARRCAAQAAAQEGAMRDELTQLPNRAAFRQELIRCFARLARRNERFALMCFDLDGFKGVNDSMGHDIGDTVLVEAAERLKASTRENDLVARLGGDEFALIAVDIRGDEDAVTIAERILANFRRSFEIEGRAIPMSVSIGVAIAPSDGVDTETLMRNADSAMYATKQAGRSGYTLFRDRFGFIAERNTLDSELDRAFAQCELFMVYQPFVDMATLETTGFEALLRWSHPVRGVLSAGEIVPLFERGGQIERVGAWALQEAMTAAKHWPSHLRVSVNVSSLQLRKPDFEQTVRDALTASGLEPHRLELELNETAMILDGDRAFEMLANLRGIGVQTSLDDLGTGYSSLANLVGLPLDRLKIDRSFVANLETNPMCGSVVKLTIELARSLSLQVTAEGVENARQYRILRDLGCLEAQGYLFSYPRPAPEITELFGSCSIGGQASSSLGPGEEPMAAAG